MADGHGDESRSRFDDVFCAMLPRLYRRAVLLAGAIAAEDTVHEVYLKLVAKPQPFLTHPEPYAYAFRAMVSVVRDGHRRHHKQVLMADVGESDAAASWYGGLEERASEIEAIGLLRKLTARQAGIVILVDLDGYTIDQAADFLHLHRGTVSRSRARALDKLRHHLTGLQVSHGEAG